MAKALIFTSIFLCLVACTSSSPLFTPTVESTQKTPEEAATSEPTGPPLASIDQLEEALRSRAEQYSDASNKMAWAEDYKLTSPRSRNICPKEEYIQLMSSGLDSFRRFFSIPPESELTSEVRVVQVKGNRNQGTVVYQMLIDGTPLDLGPNNEATPQPWVLLDGQWWQEYEGWKSGCQ